MAYQEGAETSDNARCFESPSGQPAKTARESRRLSEPERVKGVLRESRKWGVLRNGRGTSFSLTHQVTTAAQALATIPAGLRTPLLAEYNELVRNYSERRWTPAELSGGKFCEIVYTILSGHAACQYARRPAKPRNFLEACRRLEQNANVPRSFQILIPRLLPALYEVRNNRGVGHTGGDVDPNHMDATAVLAMTSWIMAELVRVFHNVDVDEAQQIVDSLAERRIPLVWASANMRRVLKPELGLQQQIMVLIASAPGAVDTNDLFAWTGYDKRGYFNRLLRKLHAGRFVELAADCDNVELLPPGAEYADRVIAEHA